MLSYNEITTGRVIAFNDEPHKVLSHRVFRMQQRKPVNVTKLKSLKTGKVVEHSFQQSEKVEEAELEKKTAVFVYGNGQEYIFHEENNPGARFSLSPDIVRASMAYLKQKESYTITYFNEEIMGLEIPIKMTFLVQDAPPAVKGNTATGATKVVTLETGATVTCPLFIQTGDRIEVNTETGEYVARVEKV